MEVEPYRYVGKAIVPPRREERRPSLDQSASALLGYVDDQFIGVFDESGTMDRIEELLDDDQYWRLSDTFESLLPASFVVSAARSAPPFDVFLRVAGAHLTDAAAELTELLHEQIMAIARFMTWTSKQPPSTGQPPPWADTSISMRHRIDAPTTPAFLARSMLGAVRSNLCIVALRAPRTIALTLAVRATLFREASAGLRKHLTVLASLPETEVPEHIVPTSARLDLSEEIRRANEAELGYQAVLDMARARGEEVFPPVVDREE